MKFFIFPAGVGTILLIGLFVVLQAFQINPINLLDWGIIVGGFWWLLIITTIPWNTHFKAKEILHEITLSLDKDISVKQDDIAYATKISKRYLFIAIILHVISTIGLALLSYFEISQIGYIASVIALLLTFLRPSIRLYEYISYRLSSILKEVKHPREDVVFLKNRIIKLEKMLKELTDTLDQKNPNSYRFKQEQTEQFLQNELIEFKKTIEILKVTNQSEHELLEKRSETAIAQLSEDSQFLNHAREIIRFFKKA